MENFEANEIRIADYLDNRLTPAEEEAFMKELGENGELRRQYEDELLMQGLVGNREGEGAVGVGGEGEEPGLGMGSPWGTIAAASPGVGRAPVRPMFRRYRLVAAASIVIIAIAGILIYNSGSRKMDVPGAIAVATAKKGLDSPIAAPPAVKRTPAIGGQADTGLIAPGQAAGSNGQSPQLAENAKAVRAYKRFYEPYSSKNDPVQVSLYYQDYKQARYDDLLEAKDIDASFREMGAGGKEAVAIQYLHLYQGLAYLATDRPGNAIPQFELVLRAAVNSGSPYYDAQWYAALASLKINNVNKATAIARQIIQSDSPYKDRAAELLKEIN
jgi:hypothetical protein